MASFPHFLRNLTIAHAGSSVSLHVHDLRRTRAASTLAARPHVPLLARWTTHQNATRVEAGHWKIRIPESFTARHRGAIRSLENWSDIHASDPRTPSECFTRGPLISSSPLRLDCSLLLSGFLVPGTGPNYICVKPFSSRGSRALLKSAPVAAAPQRQRKMSGVVSWATVFLRFSAWRPA